MQMIAGRKNIMGYAKVTNFKDIASFNVQADCNLLVQSEFFKVKATLACRTLRVQYDKLTMPRI